MNPTLFDNVRSTDPETSHAAAKSMEPHLRDQQAKVLRAVVHGHLRGATAWEAARFLEWIAIQQNVASKRLGELERLGFVEWSGTTRPGSSNRQLRVYVATDKGREAAR